MSRLEQGGSPVVNNEVCERELVGVEEKRCDTEGKNGYPEVYQVWRPERQCHVEQHQQGPHAKVNTRAGEAREKNAERDPGCCEPTACGNVSRATKSEVVQDRMCVNLSGEDFKHRGERHELFAEPRKRTAGATLDQFCQDNVINV